MDTLLLGSQNPGKIGELRALLRDLPLELVDLLEFSGHFTIEETGNSYGENAKIKALNYAKSSGLFTLADDSGLEVDALGGAPGVRSARLLDSHSSDADRRRRLLQLLQSHSRPWTARFRCFVALADPEGNFELAEGICEGQIIPEERGCHGFGYDPIFRLSGKEKTMAELSMEEKNQLSHRARAVKALLPVLKKFFGLD